MNPNAASERGPIYDWVFAQLPTYQLPRPWDFVKPDSRVPGDDTRSRRRCFARHAEKFYRRGNAQKWSLQRLPGGEFAYTPPFAIPSAPSLLCASQ